METERLEGGLGVLRAVELLRRGGTVAFPTETVYGLGANALDQAAVERIFTAKERPEWDPIIVHISNQVMLEHVAVISDDLSERVDALMEAFWPGPLTLLLPRTSAVPDAVTAGRPLVGVRMPAHPLALELIEAAQMPLAAPSANRFGRISPTTAQHVLEDLDGRIDAVLDGGPTMVGVESTVLDVEQMLIYRPGAVTAEMIAAVAGEVTVFQAETVDLSKPPDGLPSPGVGLRHYAPQASLELVDVQPGGQLAHTLLAAIETHRQAKESVGVMLPQDWVVPLAVHVFAWGPWGNNETLARRLFAGLRSLDEAEVSVILCPLPTADGVGLALRDRLQKAARKK
jgi:L-threonylcarbamoyladenylate synthase